MAFIDKTGTNKLNAYLTPIGRERMLNGDKEESIASFFILGDSDRNYSVSTDDRIRNMLVPDLTGDRLDSLYSIAPNIEIRSTVGSLKPTEEAGDGFVKKTVYVETPDLTGQEVKMIMASRVDSFVDEQSTLMGNLYKSFNLPITNDDKELYTNGELFNSALEGVNTDKVLVVEVPKNTFGEMIDGKTIMLQIPKQSGGYYKIYSTFFKNELVTDIGNQLFSDPNRVSENYGGKYVISTLPAQETYVNKREGYSSSIAYLFCDDIKRPQGNPSYTWENSGSYFIEQTTDTDKLKDKHSAVLKGTNKDMAVGIAYLNSGFLVITDPTIIAGIKTTKKYSPVSGTNNSIQQFYYDDSLMTFSSYNTEFIQHVVCLCLPNEFYETTNQTYNANENRMLAITEIGLYNSSQELIAIAKTNRPLPKDRYNVLSFDISIRV